MKKVNKKPWYVVKQSMGYPNISVRLGLAIIAAQLLILYEEKHTYQEILINPYYYVALGCSTLIAFLLIEFIVWVTRFLDHNFPWGRSIRLRMPRQLAGCVFLPLFPAVILATGYFLLFEINILETVYFSRYLQQIVWMLIAFNAYLFYCWVVHNKTKTITKSVFANLDISNQSEEYQDIACIFIDGKNYFAYRLSGEKIIWADSLLKSIRYLNTTDFYMVNRAFIVSRKAIVAVKIISPKKTSITLSVTAIPQVDVSQRENVAFKNWLANPRQ